MKPCTPGQTKITDPTPQVSVLRGNLTPIGGPFDEGVTRSCVEWIVPALACVMGDRGVRSPGKKPKGSRSIRGLRARGRPDG